MPGELDPIIEFLKSIYPFRTLGDEAITQIAGLLKPQSVAGGEVIYQEGSEPGALYLIQQGRVRLTRGDGEHVAALRSGDLFGFDALGPQGVNLTTAVAISNTNLLCISPDALAQILERAPVLQQPLMMLANSYFLMLRVNLPWLGNEEAVYFIARRHPFFLLIGLMAPLLVFVVSMPWLLWKLLSATDPSGWLLLIVVDLIGVGAWLVWDYVDWSNDYSIVTSQRVLFQERIVMLYDSRQEAPLHAVLAVSTDTSQLGRLLKFGNVRVRTYAGLIVLAGLENPEQVAALVEGEWFNVNVRRSRAERETIEQILRQQFGWFGTEPRQPKFEAEAGETAEPPPAPSTIAPGSLQNFLANLFRIRSEKDGIITYRTHWFILLRRIWLPSMLLLGLLALVFFRFFNVFTLLTPMTTYSLAGVLFIILSSWWIYRFIDWRNDYYVITQDQVLDVYKKPLGREERRAAPLRNIQSVEFERLGLLGLFLNFGTVYIRVGETELTFDYVFNPSQVQQELFNRIAEREFREREAEINGEHQRLAEWFEIYDRVRRNKSQTAGRPRQQ